MALGDYAGIQVPGEPEVRAGRLETETGWLYIMSIRVDGENQAIDACHVRDTAHTLPASFTKTIILNNEQDRLLSLAIAGADGALLLALIKTGRRRSMAVNTRYTGTA